MGADWRGEWEDSSMLTGVSRNELVCSGADPNIPKEVLDSKKLMFEKVVNRSVVSSNNTS